MRVTLDIAVNAVMFCGTAALILLGFRKDGQWQFRRGLKAFRYFTILSNVLCALSALAMALCVAWGAVTPGARMFKYLGAVSVTVTLLTVLLFLGPTQGYRTMLSGSNLWMHLINPLLAILSYCLLERQPMGPGAALAGALPVALYGLLYLRKVVYAPEAGRWEDFYGFNRNGKWPVAFGAMLAGALAVCMAFWLV